MQTVTMLLNFSILFSGNVMILGMMLVTRLATLLMISFYDGTLAARQQPTTPAYRLPDTVVPRKYILEIFTNVNENHFNFNGQVLIRIQCLKATNKIILHSKDLEIVEKKVSLKKVSAGNKTINIPITEHSYSKENEFYIITLAEKLVPGSIYLYYIPFKGNLSEGLAGYYRSSYFDRSANKTKWLAVTQFEPTDARRAFPCFDEPAMKATFAISLGHDEKLKAISNMPLKKRIRLAKSTYVLDKFEETVPMSTYLVAFMVSDFEFSEAPKKDSNVTFRIWARKGAIEYVGLAKEIGPKILTYFSKYFDVAYPLPKQDMAAIPDFYAGAMENWGLITYREIALLYDPKSSPILHKSAIAYTISHELAHQWFGNLVTMKWWTDLWLNEGFATYVGFLGVNHVFPEWNVLDAAFVRGLLTIFSMDALIASHPVSIPIGHPSEIKQIFNTISYEKGSNLIRMMNMFLGEDVFRKSVTNYLRKHKYSNADQDDLWDALTRQAHAVGVLPSNITVKMIMDTWTLQTGYPLITVTRDYEKKTVTVRQDRYVMSLARDGKRDVGNKEPCWWIPLSYTTSKELKFNDTRPKMWLTCSGPITFETDLTKNDWILFNIKIAALFRVNYDEGNWKILESSLTDGKRFSTIDPLNRVQVIADVLALAWIGKLEYPIAFNIIQYLQHEPKFLSWYAALSALKDVREMLRRTPIYGYFKRFIRRLMEPSYQKLRSITNIPDDFEGTNMNSLIVSWSCISGVGDCEEQTQSLFKAWYKEPNPDENNPIPKDLRSIVYCNAVKAVGEPYWEFLWERYQKSNAATDKNLILSSLGCVRELWLLQRYLTWSLNPEKVRKHDSTDVFRSVASNEIGYLVAKHFFMRQFGKIRLYHDTKSSRVGEYITSLTEQITSEEELNEFQSFLDSVRPELKESEISIKQGMETATHNIAWHTMHYEKLSRYFENNYQ